MASRPPEPERTPSSVGEALTLAAVEAGRTMRGRAARALAQAQRTASGARRRARCGGAVVAVAVVALLGAGVARTVDPPEPQGERLLAAIIARDRDAVVGLIEDGALAEIDARRPTAAVESAMESCDVAMVRLLTDAGARRSADQGRAREDVALTAAIRHCPAAIEEVWSASRTSVPGIRLVSFAAVEGSVDAVRALARLGLPVDEPGGPSPLEAAIVAGRADTAHALISLGADPRRRTADGITLARLLRDLHHGAGDPHMLSP